MISWPIKRWISLDTPDTGGDIMQLLDKQRKIVELLQPLLEKCKEALRNKKVTLPTNLTLTQVPDFINLIEQDEFEFFMNFFLIDSVGSPNIPNTGQSWYGSDITTEIVGLCSNPTSWEFLTPIDFQNNTFTPNTRLNKRGWITDKQSLIDPVYNHYDNQIPTVFGFQGLVSVPDNMTFMEPESF